MLTSPSIVPPPCSPHTEVVNDCTVHLVKAKPPAGGEGSSAAAPAATAGTSGAAPAPAAPAADPFAAMMGAGASSDRDAAATGGESGGQAQGGNFLEQMMRSTPELREAMDSQPELRHALRDPALMQQAMRAAMDPEYRAAMMRNHDQAMRNVELMPGGFNAMARAYHGTVAPLQEGLSDMLGGARRDDADIADMDDAESAAAPGTAPLPNPWARPAPAPAAAPSPGLGGLGGLGMWCHIGVC